MCVWEERRNAERAVLCYFQRRLPSTILSDQEQRIPPSEGRKKYNNIGRPAERYATLTQFAVSFRDKFSGICDGSKFAVNDVNDRRRKSFKVRCHICTYVCDIYFYLPTISCAYVSITGNVIIAAASNKERRKKIPSSIYVYRKKFLHSKKKSI